MKKRKQIYGHMYSFLWDQLMKEGDTPFFYKLSDLIGIPTSIPLMDQLRTPLREHLLEQRIIDEQIKK